MVQEKSTQLSVVESRPVIQLTEEAIQTIQRNIEMSEKLVMTVLEKDIDYGIHPGTESFALRDPGASKITNTFNCYPEHRIVSHQETEDIIAFQIQVSLINRQTGIIVGTGMGACSTMESKYGFRWVENPEDYGYRKEDLKRRRRGKYRIPNPEIADLGNTILKMATKRAEIDACQSLPGVASALKKLFGSPQRKEPDWAAFYGRLSQLGLSEERAHEMLEVKSFKEWIDKGKTLNDAIKVLSSMLANQGERQETAKDEQPEEPMIDLDWLQDTLKEINWSEETAKSWLAGKFKVAVRETLAEMLKQLTHEQADTFCKELQSRLASKQAELWD